MTTGMNSTTSGMTSTRETESLIASDKVEGTAVRRSNGETVGCIERVMIEKRSGKVAYAIMSFGGFLGLGESYYPIPWDQLRYNEQLDGYELNISEDRLRNAPSSSTLSDLDWDSGDLGGRVRNYYGAGSTGSTGL